MRNNGICDHACMTAGCNWDDGECSYLFLTAGESAAKPCTSCDPNYWYSQNPTVECGGVGAGITCFTAGCDWWPYGPKCVDTKQQLSQCPLFDSVTYHSLSSVPGLVYVKEGRGFTTPPYLKTGGEPFPFQPSQGVGRCLNAVCRTDPPPMSGVRELADGESWCDTIAGFGSDQVLQVPSHGLNCQAPGSDTVGVPCDTVGKAWGICADKPRVPGLGFDYDPADLARLLSLSYPQLFAEHKGCGTLPVVVRSNKAGRYGGGLFQAGCDVGLEEKGLCWIGGISDLASSSFIVSFERNGAGAAGGAVYTTCHDLGECRLGITKTIGLPTLSGNLGKILSFLSNDAEGYGNSIASAPSALILEGFQKRYVPGKSSLSLTFSLRDTMGNAVKGSSTSPISHMVQLLVLPTSVECSTFETCESKKLQPTESFLSTSTKTITSLLLDFSNPPQLRYCQISVEDIQIRIFVSRSPWLDAPADAAMLQQTIMVACAPCEPGWSRQEFGGGPSLGMLWTCVRCDKKQYVIDPGKHECQPCPVDFVLYIRSFMFIHRNISTVICM